MSAANHTKQTKTIEPNGWNRDGNALNCSRKIILVLAIEVLATLTERENKHKV